MDLERIKAFQNYLTDWFTLYGRTSLPWRQNYDPYRIWVSEVMLQQTQVDRVIPKYLSFLKKFPNVNSLASASQAAVLGQWQGLGYNRRGLNLHKGAQRVVSTFEGNVPNDYDNLLTIPGIGPYTANAILTFAFNQPRTVIETNVRTVFLHHFFPDQTKISDAKLEPYVTAATNQQNPRRWYSAIMDYGSYLKKVIPNPSRKSKHYTKQSKFKGSVRQVRGEVLKNLTTAKNHVLQKKVLRNNIEGNKLYFPKVLEQLTNEGFITIADSGEVSLKN